MRQGEASPCLQPLCPRVPQTVIPAKAGISFPIRVQTVFRYPLCDVNPESWTQLSRNLWLSIEKNGNWSQNYTRTD